MTLRQEMSNRILDWLDDEVDSLGGPLDDFIPQDGGMDYMYSEAKYIRAHIKEIIESFDKKE